MKLENRLFQIWLSLRCHIVNGNLRELLQKYGSPYDLYAADDAEICSMTSDVSLQKTLRDKDLSEANRILETCKKQSIDILYWQDEAYPVSLRNISDPPLLLYYTGRLPDLNRRLCVAVVGSRTAGNYAKEMTYRLSYEMAAVGVVVVSGMALGVDAVASAGALASGGETIAVMACGVDLAYPSSHATLRKRIMTQGAIVSEYPPGTRVQKYYFPARNRIISGLSQGTFVVQAAQGSGALITAAHATEQGRDIFALPGQSNDKNFEGTNLLLRDGAIFVQDVSDILGKYQMLFADVLNMRALPSARKHSALDEAYCEKLGVRCKQEGECMPPSPQPQPQPTPPPPQVPTPTPKAPSTHAVVEPPKAPVSPRVGDKSEEILAKLTPRQREMFAALPLDRAVPVGYLVRAGFTTPEILANMTILANKGLVSILPGSLYIRA